MREILDLDEAEAARAHIVISDASVAETEMAPLPSMPTYRYTRALGCAER
jgi:hypothetical protein